MLRRFALLGACGCCIVLLAGCVAVQPRPDGTWSVSLFPPSSPSTVKGGQGGSGAGAGSGSTGPASSRVGSASSPTYPGKALKSGPWTVLVEDASFAKRLQDGSRSSSGKRFLVVNVAIRNTGAGAALRVLPNQFALWSPANKVVDPYPTKLGIFNAQSVRPIDAAMGGYTSFVYELPTDSSVYTFTMTPQQGATGSMSWYVP